MTPCDGRTHNVRVGDEVHLLDDNQDRILKITPPPGPVILKRSNYSTHRSFFPDPFTTIHQRSSHGESVNLFEPVNDVSSSLWDTNYKKEGIMTMPRVNNYEKNAELLNNVKPKHDLT